MGKREIIFAVIVSIMVLCNIIGTVAVVAINVTSGRDLVKECIVLLCPPRAIEYTAPTEEVWTLPTQPLKESTLSTEQTESKEKQVTTEFPLDVMKTTGNETQIFETIVNCESDSPVCEDIKAVG